MKNVSFGSDKSRIHYGKDGINDIKYTYDLSFNGINELKLLKLIAFFVNKGGSRKFNFTSPKPFSETKSYICQGFSHRFVFKGTHDFSCKIIEVTD